AAECAWLALLAEFDRREGWRADGQLSGVAWLGWRCGMARRTAQEKLRVAHELERRPAVRDAFAAGELSWCPVRALTPLQGAAARPVDGRSRERTSPGQRHADALMDLARAGAANLDTPPDTSGADRYTLHVLADVEALAGAAGRAELLDGSPISVETLRRLSCDSALVRHVLEGRS